MRGEHIKFCVSLKGPLANIIKYKYVSQRRKFSFLASIKAFHGKLLGSQFRPLRRRRRRHHHSRSQRLLQQEKHQKHVI